MLLINAESDWGNFEGSPPIGMKLCKTVAIGILKPYKYELDVTKHFQVRSILLTVSKRGGAD